MDFCKKNFDCKWGGGRVAASLKIAALSQANSCRRTSMDCKMQRCEIEAAGASMHDKPRPCLEDWIIDSKAFTDRLAEDQLAVS
jgi:hypothetical protein